MNAMAKKWADGERNIRKRKGGCWEGRYTAGHDLEAGKPIYKNVLGRTQGEANPKAAIEEIKGLDVTMMGKYIVGAWMDKWFKNYAKIKVRSSSHHAYQGYIDNHIKPDIGEVPLEKLTSLELQKVCKKLLNSGRIDRVESKRQPRGLSPKTVRNICQVIASAMKPAKEKKIIATDPTEGCALPKLEHREMKTLPVEQLTSFLQEAKESGVFEMYYAELAARLRKGELLGLKWEEIDLDRGGLWVKRHGARINGEVAASLKTKNANQTLPPAEDTIQLLKQQRKKRQQPLGVPLPHRAHLPGQCTPYALPGAEAGRATPGEVPRLASHLCHPGLAERRGCQNCVRHAGALLGGVHPGHLRPCHHRGPAGGSQDHERGAGRCYADLNLYLGSRHRNLMS